ncbi:MAG: class I SAM-dependent methyltransferase [Magnetococcales bacterium]|nr:class I SAM-dependent methyltransferase [Magnetococcales bacterium]
MTANDPVSPPDADFYSQGWEQEWGTMRRLSPMARHTRRWIFKVMERAGSFDSVVDFGAGDGNLLQEVQRRFPKVALYGTDFAESSVARCRKRLPTAQVVQHDLRMEHNPFGKVLDLGICSEVIEHIDRHQEAVRHMGQWCRRLILTVPGGELDEMARNMGHLRHYDETGLCSLVTGEGLKVLYSRTWGWPLAYPWYARLRNRAGYDQVIGTYGPGKRLATYLLYALFFGNDLFSGGNKIFLLLESPACAADAGPIRNTGH